jgi:hypothetical protein
MPYVINNSRNQLIAVVQDGTINTTATSQTLVGKNVTPYGEVEMENLVHQLENFADSSPPVNPIAGQLWFDTANNVLNVRTTTNTWKPVRAATAASTAPTVDPVIGDLWFDTVSRQLKIYDVIGSSARWLPSTKASVSASEPAPTIAGEFYFNTGSQQLFLFNGASWLPVGSDILSVGVLGGTGIAISGSPLTSSGNITVTNTGVTNVATGTGIATSGGNGSITLTNTGVTSLATGNGVSVNQSNGSVTITNTGVIGVATGSGIATTAANGTITLTNTGVTGITTGTGVSVNQSTGVVNITNTGVTNVAVGTGIATTAGNGAITLTNTGVTSLATGNGVSVNQSNGSVTITNTGVTRVIAGTNIAISPGNGLGNVTISSTAGTGGTVLVDSFGAVGDGVTNDSAAFQAAIDSLGSTGGIVLLSANKRYRIGTTVILKPSCHLQGQQVMIGSNGYNYYTDYNAIGSALWIDSTATINMKSGSSISRMLIRQRGMTYISPASFAGTAITVLGTNPALGNQGNTTTVGDDVTVQDCMFLGFNQAISATYAQRLRVTQCNIDCINGILLDASFDVPYINRVHCWPFATIAAVAQGVAPNPNGSALTRSGTAFKFQNTVDWGKITDCFSYGYFRGFWIENCNSCELTGCGADNVIEAGAGGSGANGFLGFVISGGSTDTILTNCQSASNEKGFYINTVDNIPTQMINCVAWSNRDTGTLVEGGDVTVMGGIFRQTQRGIQNTNANNRLIIQNARFSDITVRPIDSISASTYINGINFQNFTGSSPASLINSAVSIPGTNSITIPNQGDFFVVSAGAGSGLGNVRWGWPGRLVTLKFSTNVTIFQGAGNLGDMFLAGNTNFVATTNSTLTIISDGTFWYEIGRSQASSNREIVSAVTTTLTPGQQVNLNITNGAATYSLLQVGSSHPARIRIYSSDTARTADAARPVGTDPLPGSGVIAEVITFTGLPALIPGALTQNITPGVVGFTEDDSNTIPLRITNNDNVNRTITISLRLLKMEV